MTCSLNKSTSPPRHGHSRTDDGEQAAPFLRVKERVKEPEGPRWQSRADICIEGICV